MISRWDSIAWGQTVFSPSQRTTFAGAKARTKRAMFSRDDTLPSSSSTGNRASTRQRESASTYASLLLTMTT